MISEAQKTILLNENATAPVMLVIFMQLAGNQADSTPLGWDPDTISDFMTTACPGIPDNNVDKIQACVSILTTNMAYTDPSVFYYIVQALSDDTEVFETDDTEIDAIEVAKALVVIQIIDPDSYSGTEPWAPEVLDIIQNTTSQSGAKVPDWLSPVRNREQDANVGDNEDIVYAAEAMRQEHEKKTAGMMADYIKQMQAEFDSITETTIDMRSLLVSKVPIAAETPYVEF